MKKYFYYSLLFLALSFCAYVAYFVFEFIEFEKHTERMTDENDPDITLVNIEDLDRYKIAEAIEKLELSKPKLIVLHFNFKRKNEVNDSILKSALCKYDNLILTYDLNKEITGMDPFLTTCFTDSGYTNFEGDTHGVRWFTPKSKEFSHIGLTAAKIFDPTTDISKIKNEEKLPIMYSRASSQFSFLNIRNILDSNFIYQTSEVENKILIMGYLGPEDDCQNKTPMNHIERAHFEPSTKTFNSVILANIIRQILDDY